MGYSRCSHSHQGIRSVPTHLLVFMLQCFNEMGYGPRPDVPQASITAARSRSIWPTPSVPRIDGLAIIQAGRCQNGSPYFHRAINVTPLPLPHRPAMGPGNRVLVWALEIDHLRLVSVNTRTIATIDPRHAFAGAATATVTIGQTKRLASQRTTNPQRSLI